MTINAENSCKLIFWDIFFDISHQYQHILIPEFQKPVYKKNSLSCFQVFVIHVTLHDHNFFEALQILL